jgi:hypothetical protein
VFAAEGIWDWEIPTKKRKIIMQVRLHWPIELSLRGWWYWYGLPVWSVQTLMCPWIALHRIAWSICKSYRWIMSYYQWARVEIHQLTPFEPHLSTVGPKQVDHRLDPKSIGWHALSWCVAGWNPWYSNERLCLPGAGRHIKNQPSVSSWFQ